MEVRSRWVVVVTDVTKWVGGMKVKFQGEIKVKAP